MANHSSQSWLASDHMQHLPGQLANLVVGEKTTQRLQLLHDQLEASAYLRLQVLHDNTKGLAYQRFLFLHDHTRGFSSTMTTVEALAY